MTESHSLYYCPSDYTFGPAVSDDNGSNRRGNFDFTVTFENIVLSTVPSSLCLALALFRIWHLSYHAKVSSRSSDRRSQRLLVLKLTFGVAYCALTLAVLIVGTQLHHQWPQPHFADEPEPRLSTTARAVAFVLSAALLPLSVLEHRRAARPSFLLGIYLLFSTLLDAAQVRTRWLISAGAGDGTGTGAGAEAGRGVLLLVGVLARLSTAAVATKFVWLIAESQRKKTPSGSTAGSTGEGLPALEKTSGLFGLVAYTWLNDLFRRGYSHVLYLHDLPRLDGQLSTDVLHQKLVAKTYHAAAGDLSRKFGLAKLMARTFWRPLLLPVLPRLALVGFRLCQPFLVHALLHHMEQSDHSATDTSWKNAGYGFIGAAVLIYFGVAASTSLYWYAHERFQCMARGALVSAIFETLTALRAADVSAGDNAAVTLMSTDVERIRVGLLHLHEFWATPVEAALASWLLYTHLGVAFVAPLAVVAASVVGSSLLNRYTGARQRRWMEAIQARVSETAHVLVNIKQLKISSLVGPVEESTQQLRVDEMRAATRFRRLYVGNMAFGFAPMALCPLITFAVTARTLDTGTVFTSLAYLVLLADPLGFLFGEIPYLLAAFTSLGRIQVFLAGKHQIDPRRFGCGDDGDDENSGTGGDGNAATEELGSSKGGPGVTLRDASVGWTEEDGAPLFRGISVKIPPAGLTIVVGPVGSGKSTLCKALLAEVPLLSGEDVDITSSRDEFWPAFSDQTPYVHNGTIRDNIIGSSAGRFDEGRYREAIESTALAPDLKILSKGDLTVVGSSGTTLSGGQKQRISMARALYHHRANFYVLDDSLSGLDADTELEVFVRCLGPGGVLSRRRATVVFATHNTMFLPLAQHIIALGGDGTIDYQGDYTGLCLSGLYPSYSGPTSSSLKFAASDETLRETVSQEVVPPTTGSSTSPSPDRQSAQQALTPTTAGTSFLSEKDRMTGNIAVYRYYLASLGKISIVLFLLFGLGWGFFYNFGYIWLRFWTRDDSDDGAHTRSRTFYIGLYALWQSAGLGSIVLCFWTSYTMMAAISGLSLHRSALRSVLHAPLWFSTTTDVGIITNLFSQDMTLVDNELPMAITNMSLDVFNALGLAAVIATSSPYLAAAYPVLIGTLYLVQKVYLRTSRQVRLLDLEAKSPLYTHFLDTAKGLSTIRAFSGWVDASKRKAFALLDESQKPTYLLAMVQRWLLFVLQCIVACLAVLVVVLATQTSVAGSGSGFTGASLVALMTFGDILNFIIRWWTQLEMSIGAVTRLKALGDKVRPEGEPDETTPMPEEWPAEGRIEIKEVYASYQGSESPEMGQPESESSQEEKSLPHLVLENLSLSISTGEKVAICGRSGSGKSSLILLLLRMLDPLPSGARGSIAIDGIPLHTVDRTTLRDRVIAMSQDPVFLPGNSVSIKRQLDPHSRHSAGECHAVLQLVDIASSLAPRQGDVEMTPLRPDSLSAGQRQLFNLARTVLRARARATKATTATTSPPSHRENEKASSGGGGGILLLDEVSASVDRGTERIMQRVIMQEFKGYTIVMVTHRLEMAVEEFDTAVVMEKGKVVERGNPRELAGDEGTAFGALWKQATGGNGVGGE